MGETEVIIGDIELNNGHIDPLYQLARSSGGSSYLGIATADLALTAIFIAAGLQYQENAQEIVLNKKIRGVVIGTFVGLVNITDGTYCYLPIIGEAKEKGTLKLTNVQRNKLYEIINKSAQITAQNLNIKREGISVIISIIQEDGERVVFSDKFVNLIFNRLDAEGDWSVGNLQVSTETKDIIIEAANKLFAFRKPIHDSIEIEKCGYKTKDKPMNELFASVREANKNFNNALSNNKTEDIANIFWDTFYSKLELLSARGLSIESVLDGHKEYISECEACNKMKL